MSEQSSWQVTIPRITCSTHTGEINTEVISWYIHYIHYTRTELKV